MAETLGQSWFDANQERPYPLSDAATRSDNDDKFFPNDLIVDMSLWYPSDLGDFAFIGGVFAGPKLTSVVIVVAQDQYAQPATYTPIASISKTNAKSGTAYKLTPMVDGVSGMIVFGSGIQPSVPVSYKFSTPDQSLLVAKVARGYLPPGVISLRRSGGSVGLIGVVKLSGNGDLNIVGEEVVIDGNVVTAAVFNLRSDTNTNLLSTYSGPCGGRPESETCNLPGIEYINTVKPDCNGNIDIVFKGGVMVTPMVDGGGVVLDYPLGLVDACTVKANLPDGDGKLPNDYADACAQPFDRDHYVDNDHTGETPPNGGTSEVLECSDLPYVDDFEDQSDSMPYHFWTNTGFFSWVEEPDKSVPYFQITSSSTSDGFVLQTVDDVNVAFWDDCSVYSPLDVENSLWGQCLKIEVGLRITYNAEAGLVIAGSNTYVTFGKTGLGPQTRWALTLDPINNYVHLKQMLAGTLINNNSISVPGLSAYNGEWLSLSAELYRVDSTSSALYFEVKDKTGTLLASDEFTGINIQPGPFGIVSSHPASGAIVDFAWFQVTPTLTGPSIGC